jgi:subtilase family serine protease
MKRFISKLPVMLVLSLFLSSLASQSVFAQAPSHDREAHPPFHVHGAASTIVVGYTPSQIRNAYGINSLAAKGSGVTLAIVDAFDDPTIINDLNTFKSTFNISGCNLTKVNQTGGTRYPRSNSGWALEISLDVEWACAVAPGANLLLVEASSNSFTNLLAAVDYAASHAQVVSMSWGGSEFSGETSYDTHFNVNGVLFFASSGDSGTGVIYPSDSPYVIGVGGTTLPLDANGNLTGGETAWSGSGGGVSAYEGEPGYQSTYPIPSTGGKRGIPDVSYDADPNTGVAVYDTTSYYGKKGWFQVGGTSMGSPQWAGLAALADQGRSQSLSGNNLVSSILYNAAASAYGSNYRDITLGTNGSCGALCTASSGYDFITGLGSPLANNLVPYLNSH